MRFRGTAAVAAFGVVLAACSTSASVETTTTTTGTATTSTSKPAPTVAEKPVATAESVFAASDLESFGSCESFLDYVKSEAIERVGPYGLGSFGGHALFAREEGDAAAQSFGTVAGTTAFSGAVLAGPSYSTTNVQVAGVDEPDIVKTDGNRIFAVARGKIFWIDVSDEPTIVASITVSGWGHQLFLDGDRLLVVTSSGFGRGLYTFRSPDVESLVESPQSPRVVLTEIDVSNPENMEAVTTLVMDGSVVSSRMTDGIVRLVSQSGPTGLVWQTPPGGGIKAEQEATEANRTVIEESTLENWVPWYVLTDLRTGETSYGVLLSCGNVGHPKEFAGFSMLSILTVDLEAGLTPDSGLGLLTDGSTVYASADSLYVSTSPWQGQPVRVDSSPARARSGMTTIHMFDITDPKETLYVASGKVEGRLLSQWSMDEYEGTLRVVVSDDFWWRDTAEPPDTSVVALQRSGEELVKVGSVDGLGENEQVYAVRMIEDKAYVVTFRQIDPLYVVDLSNPRNLRVTGELKINGYSSYLHPIRENLLLGLGQHATDNGRTLGTQLSVFDISDPTDTRLLSRLDYHDAYSEAEQNHLAFLWWAPENLAIVPMQRWTGRGSGFSGVVIVEATADGVTAVGEISHPAVNQESCEDCDSWSEPINRSLVIGNTLFTFSESGALASNLSTLKDITWMPFA